MTSLSNNSNSQDPPSNCQEPPSNSQEPNIVKNNISIIIIYSLSLATALGFNDLILSIFNSFAYDKAIIGKTIYFVVIFSITIFLCFYLKINTTI